MTSFAASAAPMMETLEARRFLSADGPRILSATTDNRGQVTLNFDQAVNPATLTSRSIKLIVGQNAQPVTITVSKRHTTLIMTARVKANTPYRVFLSGSLIKGLYTGLAMDGEFNRRGESGDGKPGGNYDISTTGATAEATFSTVYGVMNVNLFAKQTPKTYANFLAYANGGSYDNTIFHANIENGLYVLRGGGYQATTTLTPVKTLAPIANENGPSNLKGTISTYNLAPGQTTSQWYINTDDNGSTVDGFYTTFGQLADPASYTVMNALKKLQTENVGGGFSALPVLTPTLGPIAVSNLAVIYRVAMLDTFYRTPA